MAGAGDHFSSSVELWEDFILVLKPQKTISFHSRDIFSKDL